MTFKIAAIARQVGGRTLTGENLNCNICRNRIPPVIGYFRCEYDTCDYDICVRCGLGQAPLKAP